MRLETAAPTRRDAVVTALVEAQWREHERTLRLPPAVRAAVAERDLASLVESAPLPDGFREWSGHPAATRSLYMAPSNQARLGWLLNAVDDGERIVDIGCGSGSIAGRILHGKHPQRYAAIEPSDGKIAGFQGMAAENGLPASSYELHRATADQAADAVIVDVQPTLILLLEVLEHVNDPGALINIAAEAMPSDCDLLLSVPILGRIEHEWGHLSVFDRPRLERLASSAGLYTHWVQPIADLWLFVLLSKSPAPRPRLARLAPLHAATPGDAAPEEATYFFRHVALSADRTTLRCKARTSTRARIDLGQFSVVRLRVKTTGDALPSEVAVEFAVGDTAVERWQLTAGEIARADPGPAIWVFRRGSDHGRSHRNLDPASHPDVCVITMGASWSRPAGLELLGVQKLAWVNDPVRTIEVAWPHRRTARRVVAAAVGRARIAFRDLGGRIGLLRRRR